MDTSPEIVGAAGHHPREGGVIKQIENSTSLRLPRDHKVARAALRLLGADLAGTAVTVATSADHFLDACRDEIRKLRSASDVDPAAQEKTAKLERIIEEYENGRKRG